MPVKTISQKASSWRTFSDPACQALTIVEEEDEDERLEQEFVAADQPAAGSGHCAADQEWAIAATCACGTRESDGDGDLDDHRGSPLVAQVASLAHATSKLFQRLLSHNHSHHGHHHRHHQQEASPSHAHHEQPTGAQPEMHATGAAPEASRGVRCQQPQRPRSAPMAVVATAEQQSHRPGRIAAAFARASAPAHAGQSQLSHSQPEAQKQRRPQRHQQAGRSHLVPMLSSEDVDQAMQALQCAAWIQDYVWGPGPDDSSRRGSPSNSGGGSNSAGGGGCLRRSGGSGGGDATRREALMHVASPVCHEAMTAAAAIRDPALHSLVNQAVRRYVNPQLGEPDDVLRIILDLLTGGGCGNVAAVAHHQHQEHQHRHHYHRHPGSATTIAHAATTAHAGTTARAGAHRHVSGSMDACSNGSRGSSGEQRYSDDGVGERAAAAPPPPPRCCVSARSAPCDDREGGMEGGSAGSSYNRARGASGGGGVGISSGGSRAGSGGIEGGIGVTANGSWSSSSDNGSGAGSSCSSSRADSSVLAGASSSALSSGNSGLICGGGDGTTDRITGAALLGSSSGGASPTVRGSANSERGSHSFWNLRSLGVGSVSWTSGRSGSGNDMSGGGKVDAGGQGRELSKKKSQRSGILHLLGVRR